MPDQNNQPYGGSLNNLIVPQQRAHELRELSRDWPSWLLTEFQLCDLELLLNGGFSPLQGFMNRSDYQTVLNDMRLSSGLLWPIPIVLQIPEDFVGVVEGTEKLVLRDEEHVILAILHVEDVWRADHLDEAEKVYGTRSLDHSGVRRLLQQTHTWYVGGRVEGLQLPNHFDLRSFRYTPHELRDWFERSGWKRPIGFQTRNPLHYAHIELTKRAMKEVDGEILLHPVAGVTRSGDVDRFTRFRCYEAVKEEYPEDKFKIALLPLAMRMAGPREAVWHAIIRKNYGCSHFIVGRDHASPAGYFYPAEAAQNLAKKYESELGIAILPFEEFVHVEGQKQYVPLSQVEDPNTIVTLSGTDLRRLLATGEKIPKWFTPSEVVRELRKTYSPRGQQGFTIFFTGLSGAGKSTIANKLYLKLLEWGERSVTLLDGDHVRKSLSSELGFTKEHRDLHVLRLGYVASEIIRHGGIVIASPIAPYKSHRDEVRKMNEARGGFILVHISTPIEVCEQRDHKGLYDKARKGLIEHFTGVNDPYEEPKNADLTIDTSEMSPEQCVQVVVEFLCDKGYLLMDEKSKEKFNPVFERLER